MIGTLKNSSDFERGAAPELKSVEFSDVPSLFVENLRNNYKGVKMSTFHIHAAPCGIRSPSPKDQTASDSIRVVFLSLFFLAIGRAAKSGLWAQPNA